MMECHLLKLDHKAQILFARLNSEQEIFMGE